MYTIKILYLPLLILIFFQFILIIIGVSVYSSDSENFENALNNVNKKRLLDQCCCCQCCNCNSDNNDNIGNNPQGSDTGNNPKGNNPQGNNQHNNNNNYDSASKFRKLKDNEKNVSRAIFIFTFLFYLELFCFLAKYAFSFQLNCCFYVQLSITLFPLVISFILNLSLIIIRDQTQSEYLILFGTDSFTKKNKFLIAINILQILFIIFIISLIIIIFFVSTEKFCQFIDFLFFCKYCNCIKFKLFFVSICEKKPTEEIKEPNINISEIINREQPPNTEKESLKKHNRRINVPNIIDSSLGSIKSEKTGKYDRKKDKNLEIINPEKPPNIENEENFPKNDEDDIIYKDKIILPLHASINKLKDINPEGPNCEMYKGRILLGQKILIVMTYFEDSCNIDKLYKNGDNKTVKEAVSHYGIDIVTVNNFSDAKNELTKEENGKCPYYACWLINSDSTKENLELFLKLLIIFWKNGGAVVLFADNEPFTKETNLFLNMIKAGFSMDGSYIGKKEIYGDDSGLLKSPALFNRKKAIYKYKDIQRQSLSHNLYNIYEGVTISSVTKNNKRGMNVAFNDIKPFIPFARDSEGGITSLMKLADDGYGDIIIDGGFTKLFINMKEKGTFRYVQNIAGFTARPEVHIYNGINPKDYRPKRVKIEDANNL